MCMKRCGQNAREWVALVYNPVAPAVAVTAADAIVYPVISLKIPVVTAAVAA